MYKRQITDCRHIISVFKLVQDLLAPSKVKGKSQFQLLMDKLPGDHKADVYKRQQFAEYALGCLYLKGEDVPMDAAKAILYLKSAAIKRNEFAEYRLGKLYLTGEDVPKNVETALQYLTASANQGNQYAQYTLGKLYLMGKDILKDKEEAVKWFTLSAAQGNIYAQFFLDHIDEFKEPSVMLAATRLLHHMSRIIGDTPPARIPPVSYTHLDVYKRQAY